MSDNKQNDTQSSSPHHHKVDFAKLNRLILKDLEDRKQAYRYSVDDIKRYLENPIKNENKIREISRHLYDNSPNYKRLVTYFASMLTLDYTIEPYGLPYDKSKIDIEKFYKNYQKALDLSDVLNLKHEVLKILKIAFRDDVFYGYEHLNKSSYVIQKLNPDYCKISSVVDGIYNFEFDFSYFDKKENDVNTYSEEFQIKYQLYKTDIKNLKWQELDDSKTICLKINEELEYPYPPFASIFESVYDIQDYKSLKKAKTEIDNYAILLQKIPMKKDADDFNRYLIDEDSVMFYHNMASNATPDAVGVVTSPMDMEVAKFNKDRINEDNVAMAERDYFNATGVSQQLFNADKASSVGLSKSIQTDEQIALNVLRQIERWVNRKFKQLSGNYKFRANFLNTTVFNVKDVFERYLKSAQYGMPVVREIAASLGLSPSSVMNNSFLENDILDLHSKLRPLSSSHTQSGSGESGQPSKNEDELSDEGLRSRDQEGNIRRNE